MFRIIKLGSRSEHIQIVAKAVMESLDVLLMLCFLLCLTVLIISSLVYEAEHRQYSTYDPTTSSLVCPPMLSAGTQCTAVAE
jgi:hypothetical protein